MISPKPQDASAIAATVAALRSAWPEDPPEDEPIFILGSGWRSGSTLVQRLVMSTGRWFVWGEPHAHAAAIQSFTAIAHAAASEGADTYLERLVGGRSVRELCDEFISPLQPGAPALLDGQRAFLRTWLAPPAHTDMTGWGLKEVRLTCVHGRYLRLLFPAARFIVLFRDPLRAWESYRGNAWYRSWPDDRVTTAAGFGEMWADFAEAYLTHGSFIEPFLVRYEELVSDPDPILDELDGFLDAEVDRTILRNRRRGANPAVSPSLRGERFWLRRGLRGTHALLGYR